MGSLASARHHEANPNLPHDTIPLNAYNLIPGAAFMVVDEPDPRVWIVEKVGRDVNFERVYVWAHDGTFAQDQDGNVAFEKAFNFDFNTTVALVGLAVDPSDPYDNDWGTSI